MRACAPPTTSIGRAEADGRGVAIAAAVGNRRATSRMQTPRAPRACAVKTLKPKPHGVERSEALPALVALPVDRPRRRIDLAVGRRRSRQGRRIRRRGLAQAIGNRPLTVIDGGIAAALALAAADNAAGALTVKVLRAADAGRESGVVRALDLKGLPLGEARFAFKARRPRSRGRDRPAGRDPQRRRAA